MKREALIDWGLVLIVVAGLAVDAYVHFDLAPKFSYNNMATFSETGLFRAEAIGAIIAALAVVAFRRWYTVAFAAAVSGGGAFLVYLYANHDVGAFGPLPDMYDPGWYTEKTLSFWAEVIAFVAALALLAQMRFGFVASEAGRRHRPLPN